jgi:hypothetical protein
VWIMIWDVDGPKNTWTYMLTRDDPNAPDWGTPKGEISRDSATQHYSYTALLEDLRNQGIPSELMPGPDYFEPRIEEREEEVEFIVRKVPAR